MKPEGLFTLQSRHDVPETARRIIAALQIKGIRLYLQVDQQAEAAGVNIQLRPLIFLLFGNPAKGGVLMQQNSLIAIDLPLKAICYADETGTAWVACNEPSWLLKRFSLPQQMAEMINIEPLLRAVLND